MSTRNDGRTCWPVEGVDAHGKPLRLPPPVAPSASVLKKAIAELGVGFRELHILVATKSGRRYSPCVTPHVTTAQIPTRCFLQVDAFGFEAYVTSPELTFLQIAATGDLLDAIAAGSALCSAYRFDTAALGGVVNRYDCGEAPWTTPRNLEMFAKLYSDLPGARRALQALKYVYEGARSPKESGIALACGLPYRMGGYALGTVTLNPAYAIYIGQDVRGHRIYQERIPDVVVTAKQPDGTTRTTGIDYDPRSTHGTYERMMADTIRRNQIASLDCLTHFTLITEQVMSYPRFASSMDDIRRSLHVRRGPRYTHETSQEVRRLKLAQAEARRYALWERVVHSSEAFGADPAWKPDDVLQTP